ncbi:MULTISPECIES: zinc-binding dehydrogenase [Burkholderia]|uniref:zinc-binding dehydrogenase n=1 Tax=Burkholderia TaxID=32008 RepID=UPI000A6A8435|nr:MULTISPECIES: zinc-binding dehydrogenase [Burkholderia]MCA8105362.1 zinc-binding dehydrogenase [Burkholderia sp. AU36459]MDF3113978.1 zinc-binding dehydrogenase [Burkholderia semiarida]
MVEHDVTMDMNSTVETMGAWTWQIAGAPSALVWQRVPRPAPGPGEVLVRNRAAGLNPVDWKFIDWGAPDWRPGHVPGVDGAGEVVSVGAGIQREWLGVRVAYHQSLARDGSFAQYTVVPARAVLRLPPGLGFAEAATLPCPMLTAWQAMQKVPHHPGAEALVSGAGGAVGTLLVQLAVRARWRVSVMCNARHFERMARLGASTCLSPDIGSSAFSSRRPFDAVFDTVSGQHAVRLAASVGANGHLVCIQDRLDTSPVAPFTTAISLHEVALNALHAHGSAAQWRTLVDAGERLLTDVLHRALAPLPIEPTSVSRLPEALESLKAHTGQGRPVAVFD